MGQWVSSNHNNADEYVGSSLPFVTGSVVITTTPQKISFPYVTRWIVVTNTHATAEMRFGFTENGVNGNPAANSNYFLLNAKDTGDGMQTTPRLEVKCTSIWVRGDTGTGACSIIAGYTNIPKNQFLNLTGSASFSGVG
jgi:hypothetical protein